MYSDCASKAKKGRKPVHKLARCRTTHNPALLPPQFAALQHCCTPRHAVEPGIMRPPLSPPPPKPRSISSNPIKNVPPPRCIKWSSPPFPPRAMPLRGVTHQPSLSSSAFHLVACHLGACHLVACHLRCLSPRCRPPRCCTCLATAVPVSCRCAFPNLCDSALPCAPGVTQGHGPHCCPPRMLKKTRLADKLHTCHLRRFAKCCNLPSTSTVVCIHLSSKSTCSHDQPVNCLDLPSVWSRPLRPGQVCRQNVNQRQAVSCRGQSAVQPDPVTGLCVLVL